MISRAKPMIASAKVAGRATSTVAAGVARGLMRFAVAKGADPAALSARSGVMPEHLEDPDGRVPFANYMALMRAGQDLCTDPALALHYAEHVDLSEISIVGLVTHACETMLEAFIQIGRYNRLVAEHEAPPGVERFALEPAGKGLLWVRDYRENPNAFPESTEGTFARLVCGPRLIDPTPFCKAVHVTHAAPAYRAEYDRIFRAPVVFESDRNALLIDQNWVNHKIAPRQRYAFGVLSEHAEALLRDLQHRETVTARVEAALMPILHTGEVGMERIARELGFSRQTLLRRLKSEGATFEQALDGLRHRLALHYLAGRKVSVYETAYLVGFSDPAAFSRAFKRWTGTNPQSVLRSSTPQRASNPSGA